jgi:Holliday junction DNA helicase RuvA
MRVVGTAIIDIFTRSVAAQFMIAYIRGNLVEKSPTGVVLENQGIGYFLHVSLNTYTEIQDKKECTLHTYLGL